MEKSIDTIIFLSGTTRGSTLEGVGRSIGAAITTLGMRFVEISLLDTPGFLESVRSLDFSQVRFVFSFVSMGADISMRREDGSTFNLWEELGVPFLSLHGDSPAYFFDRHVVKDSRFISMYSFPEHAELRRRLPRIHGQIELSWPFVLDEIDKDRLDFGAKQSGTLIFLKNGRDPAEIRRLWADSLEPEPLEIILELAAELAVLLDHACCAQIDDVVMRYFRERSLDVEKLTKLRLFLIAQLDDYVRAVKCTRVVEALLDFPVEIIGNHWGHINFRGKRAKYTDDCNYARSTDLVRRALGMIDISPNTRSRPHDRVMRAYGAHTLCLTNEQAFLQDLPYADSLSYRFEKGHLQDQVSRMLGNKNAAVAMGVEVAEAYKKLHTATDTITHMLRCASLAKLDNLRQRPAGSQDFFVWPPSAL